MTPLLAERLPTAGRLGELEGAVLRRVRRGVLDHRGQDTGLGLADGPVGTGLRLSSWSILVPQALAGVGSVALLYATVRRWAGPAAGLLAGAVLATTPVAVLMFRFNNPDALLVLVLLAGAYGLVRAVEAGSTRWLMLAGAAVGLGFLTANLGATVLRFLLLRGWVFSRVP